MSKALTTEIKSFENLTGAKINIDDECNLMGIFPKDHTDHPAWFYFEDDDDAFNILSAMISGYTLAKTGLI